MVREWPASWLGEGRIRMWEGRGRARLGRPFVRLCRALTRLAEWRLARLDGGGRKLGGAIHGDATDMSSHARPRRAMKPHSGYAAADASWRRRRRSMRSAAD